MAKVQKVTKVRATRGSYRSHKPTEAIKVAAAAARIKKELMDGDPQEDPPSSRTDTAPVQDD